MRLKQEQIIAELGVKPSIDPEHEFRGRSRFLVRALGESGARGFVLGISGGQDSLLAGLLAMEATKISTKSGHPAEFYAALLPYRVQADRDDALAAVEFIRPHHVIDMDIASSTEAMVQSFVTATNMPVTDFNKGNVKARDRMIAQYLIGAQFGLITIGTDHATEAAVGFFTKHGDGACDYTPLRGLNKRQGRQILTYLGAPDIFMQKAPTADLLDDTPSQTDEAELGVTIAAIDDYLEGKDIGDEDSTIIEVKFDKTAHKRSGPIAYTEE